MSDFRKIAPEHKPVTHIELPEVDTLQLPNGTLRHNLVAGEQELVKLDILFNAGLKAANKPLQSSMTAKMMTEGSNQFTARTLAEQLDFYGAYLHITPGYDYSILSFLTLTKHLDPLLPYIKDVAQNPIFPEKEFEILKTKRQHKFLEDSEKVSTLAQRRFFRLLMGEDHPYAPFETLEPYKHIKREDLMEFHHNNYQPNQLNMIVCGKAGGETLQKIDNLFGNPQWSATQTLSQIGRAHV